MKKIILWGIVFLLFVGLGSAAFSGQGDIINGYHFTGNAYDDVDDINGTVIGATLDLDKNDVADQAYHYDGTDDYIDMTTYSWFNGSNPFTISLWFNLTKTDIAFYGEREDANQFHLTYKATSAFWFTYSTGNNVQSAAINSHNTGEWYHLAVTFNGSDLKIYRRGVEIATGAVTTYEIPADFFLGGQDLSGVNVNDFSGNIDEFLIANVSFTASQIVELNNTYYDDWDVLIVPSASLNLSAPLPENNSQFNTQELNINLTANSSSAFDCNLYINNTFNQTRAGFSSGINIRVDFNVSFAALEENTYNFIIGCTNLDNDTNTSSHTFRIDNANPTIDEEDINNSYQESTLTYSINVSDVFLYSFQMNDSCGNNYFNNTSIAPAFSFTNFYNIESCSVGTQETNISVCDGNGDSLNCVNVTYYWNKTAVVNITAYDVINGAFIDVFTINDSGKSISTTDGNVSFWQYAIGDYSLTLDAAGYAIISVTVSFNASINTYQFNLYTTNSFNFTFRHELTEEVINQNITVEFISDIISYNYTAENGTLYADVMTPTTYTIRYYSSTPTDYGLIREYIYRLTNRTHQDLTLWMIDDSNSTEITITVYDETSLNLVENAIVYVQRYFIEDNSFKTVAMYSTDVAGKSYFDVDADDQYYKILIDFPWETRKYTSGQFYFSGTAYNVYISFLEEIAEGFFDEDGIRINIAYSNPTSKFTATWVDSEAVATQYCLYLKKYGQYSKEILNYSCSTAHSGSIELTGFGNDTINYAIFTATIAGDERVIASSWKELVSDKLDSGAFGVYMTAVLVGMFAFMVSFHIISLILGAAALIFSKMIGILDLGWPYIFGIFFATVILALMLRLWKR